MRYLLLIVLLPIVSSCGLKKKKDSHAHEDVTQIFVKGDPKTLIKGTDANPQSFITTENFQSFNSFYRSTIQIFAEKSFYKKSKNVDIEEGNEPSDGELTNIEPALYSFIQNSDPNTFKYKDSKNDVHFYFQKKVESNTLELSAYEDRDGNKLELTSLHFSISPDKTKFSFLAIGFNPTIGNILISAVFYKKNIAEFGTLQFLNKQYNYIGGPGVKTALKLNSQKQVIVDICPEVIEGVKRQSAPLRNSIDINSLTTELIETSLKQWNTPFKNRRLNQTDLIKLNYPSRCKPFSDVNQNAIYWLKNYLEIPDDRYMNTGFTLPSLNRITGEIFGSDIFMIEAELDKFAKPNDINAHKRRLIKTYGTLGHEFGHFLGLDHNFEDKQSIMSYNGVYELGYYDESAIYELYRDQLLDEEDSNFPPRLTHATSMGQES
jgi:hypothetical protein